MLLLHILQQVSWVRRRDYHLLTVGVVVYSSDQRFSVRYVKHEKVRDFNVFI